MKFLLKLLATAAVLGGLGYAGIRFWPTEGNEEREIRTDTAKIRDVEQTITASGEVKPVLESTIKSEISGRIAKILVEEGDRLERGQSVAQLDPTSLQTRLREAERSLESEQLRLEKAERSKTLREELFRNDYVGEQEYLDANTDFELAKLSLEIAQTRVEDAKEDLSKTTILAPHGGILTNMMVTDGQVISGATSVSNGTDLMVISDLSNLYMESNVNELDVAAIEIGKTLRISFDAFENLEIEGTVTAIAPAARQQNNIRIFPIDIQLKSTDERIKPGISATITIPIKVNTGAVSVKVPAVFNEPDSDEQYVYVQEGDLFRRQVVETGANDLQFVAIESGIAEGTVVALRRPPEEQIIRDDSDND